jgi:hypothetical protein
VDGWSARPDAPVGEDAYLAYDAGDKICRYDTPRGHFTIHWDETLGSLDAPKAYPHPADGVNLDGRCETVPGWVRTVGAVADQVWSIEIAGFGFPAPPSDLHDRTLGGDGGSGRYDIYLLDFDSHDQQGLLGVNIQGAGRNGVSYLAVAASYANLPPAIVTSPVDELRVTLAHEFFHAIQTGLVRTRVYRFPQWITEGTAAWIEAQVYPGIPDNFQYLRDLVGRRTELPLWVQAGCDTGCWVPGLPHAALHVYATWLFWLDVVRAAHDRLVIERLWRRMARHPEAAFRTQGLKDLQAVLDGSLPERLRDYASSLLGLTNIDNHPTTVFAALRHRRLLRVRRFGRVGTATPPPILDAQARYHPLQWPAAARRIRIVVTLADAAAVADLRRGILLRIGDRSVRRPTASGLTLTYDLRPRGQTRAILVVTNSRVLSSVGYTISLSATAPPERPAAGSVPS